MVQFFPRQISLFFSLCVCDFFVAHSSLISLMAYYTARSPNFVVPRFLLRSFYIITLLHRPISWFFHKIGLQLPFIDSDFDAPAQVLPATTSVVRVPVDLIRKILPIVKFEDLVIGRSRSSNNRYTNTNQEEEKEEEDDDRCAVCLCRFEKQDEVRGLRECFHVFHRSCLDSWMDHSNNNNSCPLCRTPFISDQDSLTLLKQSL